MYNAALHIHITEHDLCLVTLFDQKLSSPHEGEKKLVCMISHRIQVMHPSSFSQILCEPFWQNEQQQQK